LGGSTGNELVLTKDGKKKKAMDYVEIKKFARISPRGERGILCSNHTKKTPLRLGIGEGKVPLPKSVKRRGQKGRFLLWILAEKQINQKEKKSHIVRLEEKGGRKWVKRREDAPSSSQVILSIEKKRTLFRG